MTKIAISIVYAGLQLQVVKNAVGEDITPLKPISDLFGLSWRDQQKKVVEDGFLGKFLGTCTGGIPRAGDQNRGQTCILVSRVAAYLMSINPDKVRAAGNVDGAKFLEEKLNEWADALHDYEELGAAFNLNHTKAQEALNRQRRHFLHAIGVMNKTADKAARTAVAGVVKQMAIELGVPYQPELPGV